MGRRQFWLVLVLLAGCGGGGSENSSPSTGTPVIDPPNDNQPDNGRTPETFRTAEYFQSGGLATIAAAAGYASQPADRDAGDGTRIAIVDSGVDIHSDLDVARRFALVGTDFDDPAPHGTHVAGIAAASRNSQGMHGVAFDAEIVSLKIAPPDFSNDNQLEDDGVIASAIASAAGVDRSFVRPTGEVLGAVVAAESDVMNMSFTTSDPQGQVFEAMADAASAGKIMVAALGNDALTGPVAAPAIYASAPEMQGLALAVGALDTSGDVDTDFSNLCGGVAQSCLFAPGERIVSTLPDNGLGAISGTSMAAPHVAGAAATLIAAFPNKSPGQIVQRILTTADDLGVEGVDERFGHGRLNLGAALSPVGFTAVPIGGRQIELDVDDRSPLVELPAWIDERDLRGELADVLVLDEQGFPFSTDLGARIRKQAPPTPVQGFLSSANLAFAGETLDNGLSFRAWQNTERFSLHEAWQARRGETPEKANFTMSFDLSPEFSLRLQNGATGHASALSNNAQDWFEHSQGPLRFSQHGGEALALDWQIHANVVATASLAGSAGNPAERIDFSLTYRDDKRLKLRLEGGIVEDAGGVWGIASTSAIGQLSSESAYSTVKGTYEFGDGWSVFGQLGVAHMLASDRHDGGLVEDIETAYATNAALGIGHKALFGNDQLTFSILRPFRPDAVNLVVEIPKEQRADDTIESQKKRLSLTPSGQQTDFVLAYDLEISEAMRWSSLAFVQSQPGHNRHAEPVFGGGLKLIWSY